MSLCGGRAAYLFSRAAIRRRAPQRICVISCRSLSCLRGLGVGAVDSNAVRRLQFGGQRRPGTGNSVSRSLSAPVGDSSRRHQILFWPGRLGGGRLYAVLAVPMALRPVETWPSGHGGRLFIWRRQATVSLRLQVQAGTTIESRPKPSPRGWPRRDPAFRAEAKPRRGRSNPAATSTVAAVNSVYHVRIMFRYTTQADELGGRRCSQLPPRGRPLRRRGSCGCDSNNQTPKSQAPQAGFQVMAA